MAYIDHNNIQEFPFTGEFYRMTIDESLPLIHRKEVLQLIQTVPCDIAEASHSVTTNFITAKWSVYFPFDKDTNILVRNGDTFVADMYGLQVNGKVIGVFPSQLGGVVVYIQDNDA